MLSQTRDGRLHLRDLGTGASHVLSDHARSVGELLFNDVPGDGRPDLFGRRAGFADRVIAFPHSSTFDPRQPGETYGGGHGRGVHRPGSPPPALGCPDRGVELRRFPLVAGRTRAEFAMLIDRTA